MEERRGGVNETKEMDELENVGGEIRWRQKRKKRGGSERCGARG